MSRAAVLGILVGGIVGGIVLGACATSYGRMTNDVVFTRYSPLSQSHEVARRTLPPLAYRRIEQELAASHGRLAEQAIDLAHEKFDVYVPPGPPPPGGYGVLVFIAPWAHPTRPLDWRGPLDGHRLIFVSAQDSGNDKNVLDRRVPLALLAYENIRAQYPVNDQRVYLMGFSGGSRVAEIVALAYPDVFHGAILNAGSDPIDGSREGEGNYKPPAALFRAFQHSRLVFITGDQDEDHLRRDDISQRSMHAGCVQDLKTEIALRLGHHVIDTFAMDRVLDDLDAPRSIDAGELDRCNAGIELALAAELAKAAAAIARGDRDGARALLQAIDARFGGPAAPRILALDAQLAALH